MWLNVKAWRDLAHNIAASVHVGEPVVVVGRLRMHSYTVDGERKQYQELEASTVGHDLGRGTSMFRRTTRVGVQAGERADEPSMTVHDQGPPTVGDAEVSGSDSDDSVDARAGAA